jgi:hypothetical protein
MPRIELDSLPEGAEERREQEQDAVLWQSSPEVFDRIAFAERVVKLVRPRGTTVAICEGMRRVRLQSGREWGGPPGARWAVLSVPKTASRRAIATAVLGLGHGNATPYALDVLVSEANR